MINDSERRESRENFNISVDDHGVNNESIQAPQRDPLIFFDRELFFQGIFEMIGTYMFVTLIYLSQGVITKFVFGFWILIVIFGVLSGAHFNPAITLALYIEEWKFRKGFVKLVYYITAQFIGTVCAALICKAFMPAVFIGIPTYRSVITLIYSELFFTGTLCFVILWVSSKNTTPSNIPILNCAMIAAWFYIIVEAGSSLSGAAYNPVVLFVLNFIAYTIKDQNALNNVGWMILSEFAGAVCFTIIYSFVFEEYVKRKNQKKDN
jgi:glycerol uptake facilitator-like aquaporin